MPTYEVKLSDGRTAEMTTDKEVTSNEQMQELVNQQMGVSTKTEATPDQYLSSGERFKEQFMNPKAFESRRESQRAERGLASKTPLEPTGFNLANALDLPMDIAESLRPIFVSGGAAVGGTLAGAATLPTGPGALAGVVAGGAAGGMAGEAAFEGIGKMLGYEQGAIVEQLGRIAKEGAYGAAQEVGGVFIGRAINATKWGMLKAADKLIQKRGMEGFVQGFGSIATHVDKAKISFALDAVKRGDTRVMQKIFADREFANKFAKQLFLGSTEGTGNIAKQIYTLSHRKDAKDAVKALYQNFLGIDETDFETIFRMGNSVNKYGDKQILSKLANKIDKGMTGILDKAGKDLEFARGALAKSAKNVDVGDLLTNVNSSLATRLKSIGFLNEEGVGLYSINPKFALTPTGKTQANIYGQLVAKLFSTEGDDALIKAAQSGNREAIQKLILKSTERGKQIPLFNVKNPLKFGEFIDRLKSIEVQISGNEFKSLGNMSRDLTGYLQGLRQIPIAVEGNMGGSKVKTLTDAFSELADGASLLRQGKRMKSPTQIEIALKRLTNTQPGTVAFEQTQTLNKFLQSNLDIDILNELRGFKAKQWLNKVNSPLGFPKTEAQVVNLMKDAFSEGNNSTLVDTLINRVDPFLPKNLRIGELSKVHTTAEALHRDAASIMRGKFLYNSLLQPLTGGTGLLGGLLGGPAGATAGVVGGMALQQPGILRMLIKASANLSNREAMEIVAKGITPATARILQKSPAALRTLADLIRQNQ